MAESPSNETPVALVTGAGRGIGAATSRALAGIGYRLALLGRTRSRLEAVAESLPDSAAPLVLPVDLGDDVGCADAIGRIDAAFGRIDVIVNNAGVAPQRSIGETDAQLLRETLETNLVGPVVLVATAWPLLLRSRGCVVNVSSMASIDPFRGFTAYAASKSGLDSLTRSIMAEADDSGIRAFTLNPGVVETDLLRSLFDESMVPRGSALSPEQVADEVVACIGGDRDHRVGSHHPLLPDSDS